MRETVGPLNRTWLTVIGLIGLVLGLAGLLFATGLAGQVAQALSLNAEVGQPSEPAVAVDLQSIFDPQPVVIVMVIVGLIMSVLGLMWLAAQIPRKNEVHSLRLQQDGAEGLTTCDPGAITNAVEDQIETFPGVLRANAILRGTASVPELTVNVTVGDRADIREVVDHIYQRSAPDLETALEVPLQRLAVLVDVTVGRKSDKTVVL